MTFNEWWSKLTVAKGETSEEVQSHRKFAKWGFEEALAIMKTCDGCRNEELSISDAPCRNCMRACPDHYQSDSKTS